MPQKRSARGVPRHGNGHKLPLKPAPQPIPAAEREIKPRKKRTYPGETQRAKFVRLSKARVTEALAVLDRIGKLASPDYPWTEADGDAILAKLQTGVNYVGSRFARKSDVLRQLAAEFELPEGKS